MVVTWMCQLLFVLRALKAYIFYYNSRIIMQLPDMNGLGQSLNRVCLQLKSYTVNALGFCYLRLTLKAWERNM